MRKSMSHRQEEALASMRDVLQDEFLSLGVRNYQLNEDFESERCSLVANVVELSTDNSFVVEGVGVGMIDAFFAGLRHRYVDGHPSLNSIQFTSFGVNGLMGDAKSNQATDAKAEARIGIRNSYGDDFEFIAVSHSVSHSSLEVVLAAVEYFVNSERAYVKMYDALRHYRSIGRTDLVSKYTTRLSELVRNTSYSEVIAALDAGEED